MTGPGHFRHAENWLYKAERPSARGGPETAESCAAIAQVHATLALTTATLVRGSLSLTPADWHEWQAAIDPEYAAGQDTSPAGPAGGTS